MQPHFTTKDIARFWSKVDKSGDCWLWIDKYRFRNGYGYFGVNHKGFRSHRVAYMLTYGPIPEGLCVCHHCDCPDCVRPEHLFIATDEQNKADMFAKGRHARGDRHGTHTQPHKVTRGEDCHAAKLTAQDVLDIRQRYINGDGPRMLARQYGVARTNIQRIVRGKCWKHLL